jgi:hypothetical protein
MNIMPLPTNNWKSYDIDMEDFDNTHESEQIMEMINDKNKTTDIDKNEKNKEDS